MKTQPTFVFPYKFTFCLHKSNIYILKTKFASQKQYLFSFLASVKKTQTDQSIPQVFLLCLKKIEPQTFKNSSCKNPFLQCVLLVKLTLMNVSYSMRWLVEDITFRKGLSLLWDFSNQLVVAFFEASVLKVRILCVISTMIKRC